MKIARLVLIVGSLALLVACSTLPQTALIYSSRTTFGVSVTSNPTSASGMTASIGFDQLDTAYVPVAVSKTKDGGGGSKNGIKQIRGRYSDSSGNQSSDKIAVYLNKMQEYAEAVKNVADRKVALQAAIANDDNKEDAQNELSQAELTASNRRYDAMSAALQIGLIREDALSVYGKFGGKGEVSGSASGLTVGKIFSTGVAAQNLTEAARYAAATEAYTGCLKAALSVPDGDPNKQNLIKECADLSGHK